MSKPKVAFVNLVPKEKNGFKIGGPEHRAEANRALAFRQN